MVKAIRKRYLPQFYLEGFSSNGRDLMQISKEDLSQSSSDIIDLSAMLDFQDLNYEGASVLALGKAVGDFENELSVHVNEAVTEGKITSEEMCMGLVNLVAHLNYREPSYKKQLAYTLKGFIKATRSDKVLSFTKPAVSQANVVNAKSLEMMFGGVVDPQILSTLYSMSATIYKAPKGWSFLTSKRPVVVFNNELGNTDDVQLIHQATEISFPLSADTMLLLTWSEDALDSRVLTEEEVCEFNRRTVVAAGKFVFAPDDAVSWALDMVSKYKGYELVLEDAA